MHARTFLCREALWEAFEDIAREQGAPIDAVLSEAMRAYARQRSYGGSTGEEPNAGASATDYGNEDEADLARTGAVRPATQRIPGDGAPMRHPPPMQATQRPATSPVGRGPGPSYGGPQRGALPEPPPARALQRPFTQPLGQALPPPPARGGAARYPSGAMPMPPPPSRQVPMPARSQPPPLPPSDPYMAPANPYAPPRGRVATSLSLTYQNRTVEVTKERFLLGRSRSQADLVLDDPNVSRQHAAIEHVGDTWVLADLGSTNGCYVDGQRVSRRQITDGDVIEITSHQVRCTLR